MGISNFIAHFEEWDIIVNHEKIVTFQILFKKKKKICKIFKKRKKESYIEIFLFYYYYFLGPCGETDPRLYRWIVEPLELLK